MDWAVGRAVVAVPLAFGSVGTVVLVFFDACTVDIVQVASPLGVRLIVRPLAFADWVQSLI